MCGIFCDGQEEVVELAEVEQLPWTGDDTIFTDRVETTARSPTRKGTDDVKQLKYVPTYVKKALHIYKNIQTS